MERTKINKEYKDRLFSFIFGQEANREWTLSLYNAVNGTGHRNPEDIEITTIRETVYMGMKNDVSFLIGSVMHFWEHQSTWNPNMPVRMLMYAGMAYDGYIKQNRLNIYSGKRMSLPVPKCVVFYNGKKEEPDERILELREAFQEDGPRRSEPDIAVRVRMVNINKGRNRAIMEKCRPLEEYAWLVQEIRDGMEAGATAEEAVDRAIDRMPETFLIWKLVTKNRAEVRHMCITEYDEARTMEMFKEEARNDVVIGLLSKGRITLDDAAEELNKPKDEISSMLAEYAREMSKQS